MSRRVVRAFSVALAAVAVVLSLPVSASASTGTFVVTEGTTLNEDHHGSIIIAADNVALDCAGHTVNGDGDGIGIDIESRTNVAVNDCRVTGFTQGVQVAFSNQVTLSGNHAFGNPGNGFYLPGSADSLLVDNIATDNGVHGVHLDSAHHNRIESNVFSGNSIGIGLTFSNENTIKNNQSLNNGHGIAASGTSNAYNSNLLVHNHASGMTLEDSTASVVTGNTVRGSGWAGVILVNSSALQVADNTSNANTEHGFLLSNVSTSALDGNTANGNGFEGFILFDSAENTLSGNQANNNGVPGIFAGFALLESSRGNLLTQNTANSNGADGFVLDASDGNTLSRNVANANLNVGFWARNGATFNVVERNVGRGNGSFDAVDDLTGAENVWTNNNFGTTQGI